ncbi:MAG: VWA domain-containing protein [Acidobacteriia bacterium]|nr:VWA domain-containing protein [Terriglobia bacterium]
MKHNPVDRLVSIVLCAVLISSSAPAQGPQEAPYTIKARAELVLVNVTVRDKKGTLVRDLTPGDFTVLEDAKQQKIASFDIEDTDIAPAPEVPQAAVLKETRPKPAAPAKPEPARPPELRNRRLIVLFFDLSAMQPEEIDRAVKAAENYLDKQMAPADLVAVASLSSSLDINQDFTTDRAQLHKALTGMSSTSGEGFAEGSTGGTEATADTGQPFTPDDTEYNIFNTDRRLQALRSLAGMLGGLEQKKSVIYFSSGMNRTGIENQSQLRAAINAAVKANVALYTMDIRGLEAMVPGGSAEQASLRGVAPYSGRATLNQYDSNFATQETLVTLAGDTGGRALLDTNDFGQVFTRVQQDTSVYYVLGYHSSNPERDGRFRKLTVRVNRPDVKLEYRRGYYAPADFKHSTKDERERQLDEELASDLPNTDLPVYLSAAYFRLEEEKYFVPISVVVPGSAIPFVRSSDKDRATLDVAGVALDEQKRPMAQVRDTVKLAVEGERQVRRKNVQYDTGFVLPSGKFHLKFVVRENQNGTMGSFEADINVPKLKTVPFRMSSVVMAGQVQSSPKARGQNPLVKDGQELVPSVTHVFSSGQHLYLYYEVYDPAHAADAKPAANAQPAAKQAKNAINILTSVAFFQGKVKTYETPVVRAQELNVPDRHAAAFRLDVPLAQLKPGFYTCQVNVIDDAAGRFVFPRLALLVRGEPPPARP